MRRHLLLTLALVLSSLSGAWAYDWASANGAGAVYYNLNSPNVGEATVVAGEWEYRDNVTIPDDITVDGVSYKVTTIGANAFYYCYDVISVTLGKNVKTIKSGAFTRSSGPSRTIYDEKQGKNVTISGIMINIDSDSLRTIESNAFSVTTLAPNKGTDTLAIGKNVAGLSGTATYFNWVTFSNIKAFYVDPSSSYLYTDDKGILYSGDVENKEHKPQKIYRVPPCFDEDSYVIPSTVKNLASFTFFSMQTLTTITGGENVVAIGSDILNTVVKTFPVGKKVETMPTTCFMYCTASFLPVVDGENPIFKLQDSVLYKYASPDTILCQYFKIRKRHTFVVPAMVTKIAGYSFYNVNVNLDTIDYANCTKAKLKTIEGTAFLSTKNSLKFLNEKNLFDVDEYGVIYTDGFKGIRLYASDVKTETYNMPAATTEVPRNVIKTNDYVKDFNININCTSINTEHLDVMGNLEHYNVHSQNSNYSSDAEGVLYNKDKTKLLAYPRGNDRIFYKVAPGTKTIGVKAFYNNKNLVGLDLGDKLESAYEGNAQNLAYMNSLQYMRVGVATPPTVNSNTFNEDMYKRKTILYVPIEHYDIYVNASIWNRFAVVKDTSYFNGDVTSTKYSYYACHYKENLEGNGWETPERVKWEGYILTQTTAEPRDYEGFKFDHCVQASLEQKNQEIPFYYTRKGFKITWKNGEDIISSDSLKYGTQIVPPSVEITAPTGSTFAGWHYKPTSQIALTFDANSIMRFDTVFYAVFVSKESQRYTVEHRLQDLNSNGTVANTYTVVDTDMGFGTADTQTDAVAKEYHGFTAPQSIQQQSIAADGSTVVTIDYTRNKYHVTWKNGETIIVKNNVTGDFYYGSNLKKAEDQSAAAGYEFVGWNTESTATVALDLTNAKVEDDVVYHAIFKQRASKTYAVRHYQQNIDDDNYPQLPYETDIKTGIIGTKTDAAAKDYEGFNKPTITQKNIEANMTPVDLRYTRKKFWVTWMKDENTQISKTELKYGAPLNPPANPTPDQSWQHFVGWNTDKDANEGMSVDGVVTSAVTYYAIFADNEQKNYTVKYWLQDIETDSYPESLAQSITKTGLEGDITTATAPDFTGFTTPDNSSIQQQTIAAEGTVVNIFYTRNKYQVTWKKGDVAIANTGGKYKYESQLQAPAEELVPAPAGKHLLGWNTSSSAIDAIDLTNKKVEADESKNVYYAVFADNESREYLVKHFLQNANDDNYPVEPALTERPSAPFGSQTNATAKTFVGFTAPNSITQQTIANSIDNPTVIALLYVRNEYPVVWMNSEIEFARDNCKYESSVVVPSTNPVSTDEGKHFIGWNTNKNASTILDMTTQIVSLDGVVYYAIFADNDVVQYTVRHHKADLNGQFTDAEGLLSETPGSGRYGLTTNEEAETFVGFTARTPVSQQKIKADGTTVVDIYYDRNSYTISWKANEGTLNGGTNDITQSLKYGASVAEPTHSRTGYDFKGWGLTADASSFETIPENMPASNLSYVANWEIKEYPVRWNFNNGSGEFSTSYVKYGDPIAVAAGVPTKENYHFLGWANKQNGTPITDGNYGIRGTEDLVNFYAQWEIDEFELTWNPNGGEIVKEGTHGSVAFGTTPLTPATVKRTGYTFKGWALSENATIAEITNPQLAMPNENLTYYAVWQINQHKITWNANGGVLATEGTNGIVNYNTEITPATTADREGYTFEGWGTSADATLKVIPATIMPDSALTYYAIWEVNKHNLTWDANGGAFVNGNPSGKVNYGTEVTPPQVDREGWKCGGWGETSTATENAILSRTFLMPDNDLTYYAIWLPRTNNMVTWKFNDGSDFNYAADTVTTNESIIPPINNPSREHYQFIGWATAPDGPVITDFGIMDSPKKTFYAQWTINTHKLVWNANGGIIVMSGTSGDNVAYGSQIKVATADRTGYSFVGWGLAADANENDAVRITTMPDNDVEYFAIWATNTYDVKWLFNNGTNESFAVTHVSYDAKIHAPNSNPAREHYEFAGWAATPQGVVIEDFGILTTQGAIYYAQWRARKHTLGWDANGGQLSGNYTPAGEVAYGTHIDVPTVEKDNYIHAGWSTSDNLELLVNITTMPDSSVTYVANWITAEYAVEWRMNDGTNNNFTATHVDFDGEITAPALDPERTNYQFLGWSVAADGEVTTNFGTMDSDHKIFYAIWQKNSHTLTWNANGGQLSGDYTSGNVEVGTEIVRPVAERTGYTFNGWNTYAEAVDSISISTMPDNSVEYFAIWNVNSYAATWYFNADSVFASSNLNYADTIKAPLINPDNNGYTFLGWSATEAGSVIYSFGLMPAADTAFYAVWQKTEEEKKFALLWYRNDGTSAIFITDSLAQGETIVAPTVNPDRADYKFAGWSATADGDVIAQFGAIVSDTAFYALWKAQSQDTTTTPETLTFVAAWYLNDGTDSVFVTDTIAQGETIVAPSQNPVREGYTFLGWSTESAGTFVTDFGAITSDTAFYAVWLKDNCFVLWMFAQDSVFKTDTVFYGDAIIAPAVNPVREQYAFKGWAMSGDSVLVDFGTASGNESLFYAVWEEIVVPQYRAVWYFNDGTNSAFTTTMVTEGTAITAPASNPKRDDYLFKGWAASADGAVTTNFGTMSASGAAFYAVWEALVQFTAPETYNTCESGTDHIELTDINSSQITFEWNINGDIDSTQTDGYLEFTDEMALSGTIEVTGILGDTRVTKTINYQRNLEMLRTMWDDVITVVNGKGYFQSYRWYQNGVLVDTTDMHYEKGGLTGTYQLVAVTTDSVEITSCEMTFGEPEATSITVYPNPVINSIVVEGDNVKAGNTITIIDNDGKVRIAKEISGEGSEEVNVSALQQGIYVVKVGEETVSIIKF